MSSFDNPVVPPAASRARFTQLPSVPSFTPRSRATCAIGLLVSSTIRTAPSRNSRSYFFRFSGISIPIVDASTVLGEPQDPGRPRGGVRPLTRSGRGVRARSPRASRRPTSPTDPPRRRRSRTLRGRPPARTRTRGHRVMGRSSPPVAQHRPPPSPGLGTVPTGAAHVHANDREAAIEPLEESIQIATALGATPLREQAVDLARRARVTTHHSRHTTTEPPPASGRLARLTARELDVLRLISQGLS